MNKQLCLNGSLRGALVLLGIAFACDAGAVNVSAGDNHADVLPYASGNTVKTAYFDFDLDQVVEDTRLFVREMQVVQPAFYGTTNPGFTTSVGYTLPASADLGFSVPTLSGSDGVMRNVLYWDGQGSPNFLALRPGDDVLIRRSSALNTTLDGGTAPASGFSIQTTNTNGELHNHVSFQARGAGGSQPGDGFYLFAMQLEVVGLDQAQPTYFLFNADYQRDGQGQIIYNGNQPVTDPATKQLAIDWVIDSFLASPLPGDTDGDGDVDDSDLGTAFANYTGPIGAAGNKQADDGDTDGDGDVDDSDLGTAFASYTGPTSPASVPEPGSVMFGLLLGAGVMLRRRRLSSSPSR